MKKSLLLTRKITRGDDIVSARTLREIGQIHFKRKEYTNATSCLKESLKIFFERKGMDSIEVANSLLDTAFVFHKTEKHHKVIYCCDEVMAVYKVNHNHFGTEYHFGVALGKCNGLKAIAHNSLDEPEAAFEFFQQSIHLFKLSFQALVINQFNNDQRDDYMFFASIEVRKAKLHDKLGQESKAMRHYTSKFEP